MGHGHIKDKNAMKKKYLTQAVKYIEQLEKENKAFKEDPNSVVGQFISQYQELYSQNSRLSVLTACLLKRMADGDAGPDARGTILTKAEMEAFKDQRINIKWELPDGVEKPEDADQYIFTYELQPANQPVPTPVPPTETPIPECTDPNCTLPKDLAHTHDVPRNDGMAFVPDVPNVEEPQSGKVTTDTFQDGYDAAGEAECPVCMIETPAVDLELGDLTAEAQEITQP